MFLALTNRCITEYVLHLAEIAPFHRLLYNHQFGMCQKSLVWILNFNLVCIESLFGIHKLIGENVSLSKITANCFMFSGKVTINVCFFAELFICYIFLYASICCSNISLS
jgi:hypothetical protein